MMTMYEIVETLKCNRQTALTLLRNAKIEPVRLTTRNGKKHAYKITPERLLEINANRKKSPEEIARHQASALTALESAFNRQKMDCGSK